MYFYFDSYDFYFFYGVIFILEEVIRVYRKSFLYIYWILLLFDLMRVFYYYLKN